MNWYQYRVFFVIISMYFLFLRPQSAVCLPNETISEILNKVHSGDVNGVLHAFTESENQSLSFIEGRKILQMFIEEMNMQYQFHLTIDEACRLIRDHLPMMQIPLELQTTLLMIIQQIEFGSVAEILETKSSLYLSSKIDMFGLGIYLPWEWNWFGWNKKHHTSMKTSSYLVAHANSIELELPPKMAAGFICALGGALICIIPGGQSAGLTLIGTGIGLALDGIANGERPYYIDSSNARKIIID